MQSVNDVSANNLERPMNLALRFLSGIILLPVVLYIVYVGGYFIECLTTLLAFIWSYELFSMAFPLNRIGAWLFAFLGALLFLSLLHVTTATEALLVIMACCGLMGLASLASSSSDKSHSLNLYFLAFGSCYVGIGVASLVFLRRINEPLHLGLGLVYLVLLVIWANDSFAYFFGRAFGKHKLAEQISHSKTWEGFFAGALFGVGLPLLLWWWLSSISSTFLSISKLDILAIAVPGAFLGPAGDLIESKMKRVHGVKDSGNILPGHGGILDRIDALLLLAPWALCYATIFHS